MKHSALLLYKGVNRELWLTNGLGQDFFDKILLLGLALRND